MYYLDASRGTEILQDLIAIILENRTYLSEVDGAIGDGDHGVNMAKGFRLCGEAIAGQPLTLSNALGKLASVLIGSIGGSMGPLYGSLFLGMATTIKVHTRIDSDVFAEMLSGGLRSLQDISDAKVGDKCMLDTLVPAVEAYHQSLAAEDDFPTALEKLRLSAEQGKESTTDLVSKIGRSSRLGERSRGHLDAGAVSCCLILKQLADSTEARLEQITT